MALISGRISSTSVRIASRSVIRRAIRPSFRSKPMRRRDFITLCGAALLPSAARAQPQERMRRIGVLRPGENDANSQFALAVFQQALQALGWIEDRNIEIH